MGKARGQSSLSRCTAAAIALALALAAAASGCDRVGRQSQAKAEPGDLLAEGFDDLDADWDWVREDPAGWALTQGVLRVRSDPGGLAFDDDNANMPLRPAPDGTFAVEVTVEFAPASLYEQAGLVLYASDG